MINAPEHTQFRARLRHSRSDAADVGVSGAFEFARRVIEDESGLHIARFFTTDAVAWTSDEIEYTLVGARRIVDASPDAFTRRYRGVLVGPGPLNHALVTLSIRFRECRRGTADADVVSLELDGR